MAGLGQRDRGVGDVHRYDVVDALPGEDVGPLGLQREDEIDGLADRARVAEGVHGQRADRILRRERGNRHLDALPQDRPVGQQLQGEEHQDQDGDMQAAAHRGTTMVRSSVLTMAQNPDKARSDCRKEP